MVSYAFVPPQDLEAFEPGVKAVGLKNPISAEMAVMRTSVVPSLLRAVAHNRRQGRDAARLYEVATAFAPRPTSSAIHPPSSGRWWRRCWPAGAARSPGPPAASRPTSTT